MSPAQLETIIAEAPEKLRIVMCELEPHVLQAAAAALEASQDSEDGGKPKVTINLGVVIELNQNPPVWSVKGAVSVRYTAASEAEQLEETPELIPGIGKGRKAKGGTDAA